VRCNAPSVEAVFVKRCLERLSVLALALLSSLAALDPAMAAPSSSQLPALSAAPAPNDPQELEGFLDSVMATAMQQWQVPGAVILLVQDDAVIFSKGYGYADLERHVRVTPDGTMFHVFSLSKLFTATAIMQLVEQGQLDLDRDVNSYLTQVQVSDPFPQPVTIRHLLTHTAGFDSDQREIGGFASADAAWLPLDRYLARRALAPIWPPGQKFVYTNAAYDLLGLVVEDVSGQAFADYMAERLLQRLEMGRSTFKQPPPLRSDLALC
jgi:CubicO group peptidase (beta-lactamase class C family)